MKYAHGGLKKMNSKILNKADAVLAVIDFQERLLPAMYNAEKLEETVVRLVKGCRVLGTDIIVTQQYTKGIGPTTAKIDAALTEELFEGEVPAGKYNPIDKIDFSALRNEEFRAALEKTGKKSVILCGIEAHICAQQTCLELINEGYDVFVAADCVSSRAEENKNIAIERMRDAGAVITSYESILYDMLGSAKAAEFKKISKIVK